MRTYISAAITVAALTLSFFPAQAGELGGKLEAVVATYNKTAKTHRVETRAVLNGCSAEKARTCQFSMTGNLLGMVASNPDNHDQARFITVLFGKGADADSLVLSLAVLMAAYSPKADQSERSTALMSVLEGVTASSGEGEVHLEGIKYSLKKLDGIGIMLGIERP